MASITSSTAYFLHGAGTAANSVIKEDLGQVIYNVNPFQTPFMSGIAKLKTDNDLHEWLTDTLRTSVASNEVVEATVRSTGVTGDRAVRKGNYVQIADEEVTVTHKAEMMNKAGVPGKEMARQLMKIGKELQMDVEKNLLSIQAKRAPTTSVAGRSATVAAWIYANQTSNGGTDQTASTGATIPVENGTPQTFTEAMLTTQIDAVWDASGDLDNHVIMCSAAIVNKIRGFSGIVSSFDVKAAEGTIWNKISIYQSQFGPMKVIPNKHTLPESCYIFDLSTWGLAFAGGKMIHTTDIATQTSADQKLLETYYTLEARSEEANAAIYSLVE